ncbi:MULTISPECIES: PilZ domain-containing protein [Pseudoalteromonas]|uniref:PilZ domain-containing protein n=1 Tax=Pseudoalteromonas obscura TaxID=3048491 RepID=A0ABT7EJW5_9GAMM|nr:MULTISPECIES: PilZ domain-containing protein [Pseudoalteromonas]MBQ4836879.1 PilZ domain-containing protein [Pseudoalteromonas luteoviolacea]MDK2595311.1 PilZ domain-containing protein [Pseudoalteromonas sp. P94(2023)]
MIHEDKRRFMRMMVNAQAELTVNQSGEKLLGTCQDLSATGLSIEIEHPLEIGEMVAVFINSKSTTIPPFNASAKVVRCSSNEATEDSYVVGLEIVQFN